MNQNKMKNKEIMVEEKNINKMMNLKFKEEEIFMIEVKAILH